MNTPFVSTHMCMVIIVYNPSSKRSKLPLLFKSFIKERLITKTFVYTIDTAASE